MQKVIEVLPGMTYNTLATPHATPTTSLVPPQQTPTLPTPYIYMYLLILIYNLYIT